MELALEKTGLVWIVDDSPLQIERARKALVGSYALECFRDAEALLERLDQGPLPDAILLDWQLPGVSGQEACQFIREKHDEVSLPVLVQTASGVKEDFSKALAAGANDFLAKPYDDAELRARISTLVRIHQQAELLKTRADFEEKLIGIVSHDLRNPLHAILLGANLLIRSDQLNDSNHRAVSRIRSSAERATRLIRDLLDFTQARLGDGISIHRARVDLHAVIRQTEEEFAILFPDREIELRLLGSGEGEWDSDRVAQVIQNLMTNALTYSPAGTKVFLQMQGSEDAVSIAIHNEGVPIASEMLTRIFEPMQRATGSDHSGRSIGLGLYIVKQIVQAHGGTIEVHSTAAEGTTFTVRLAREIGLRAEAPRS
jgi:signal transduction histidine kinase